MKHITFIALSLLFLLEGCRVGPRYHPPELVAPENWKNPQEEQKDEDNSCKEKSNFCPEYWWEVFEEPLLNSLEEQAIENNHNLYVALERIFEARAQACVSKADLYPQVNLNPAYTHDSALVQFSGTPPITVPGLILKRKLRISSTEYSLPVNMSYEIDLWGKIRSQYESAVFNAESQEEAFYATMLTLTSDVASNYFNLKTLDAQIDLYEKTLELRRQTLALTQSRFNSGLVPYIDVTNSMLLVTNTESDYQDTVRQRNLIENAIAVLLGIPASELTLKYNPLEGDPPIIPAGVPSDILLRRPDIAQAERTMASDHALIGAAYAEYFPSLNITAALEGIWGFIRVNRDLISWRNHLWSVGANVAQFLFDAGKRECNVEATWARYKEDLGSYEQTVVTAFREVEDALNNIDQEAKQAKSLASSVDSASKTSQLAKQRYTNGLTTFLDLLDADRNELDARRSYLNVQGSRFQSTISLIKALGGGWNFYPDETLATDEAMDIHDECL